MLMLGLLIIMVWLKGGSLELSDLGIYLCMRRRSNFSSLVVIIC